MRALFRRNWQSVAWAIGAIFWAWAALSAFTGDTHQVCTGGGGVSQGAAAGECYEWQIVLGSPSWREGVWFAWIPAGLTFVCVYAAVKTWRRESFV